MPVRILNDNKIIALVQAGNSPKQIADRFGVGVAAVSKRLKKLKVGMVRDVALRSAGRLADSKLNVMARLCKASEVVDLEVDHLQKVIEGTTGAERQALQEQRLRHLVELRKQIGSALEIAQTLYSIDEVKAFQQEVLNAIAEAAPEVRAKILHNLQERRMIRSSLDMEA